MENILDKVIGFVNPSAGLKRVSDRARMLMMQSQVRKYEGARDGRRHSSWIANSNPSVKQLIQKDLAKLVARSRELSINNGYGKKAPYEIANHVVGTGIIATPFVVDKIEGGKVKKNASKNKLTPALQTGWNEWANDIKADYNGDFNFYGMQHLAMRSVVINGEVLAIRKRVTQDVNKYGFQVLIVEGDFIDITKHSDKDKDGGYTFFGVKYDKNNKRSGYWLFDRHPSEATAASIFVDIADIAHLYDVERTGQSRGVPASAPTILTQKDLADYMDAELLAKKGAACFSAIVQKVEDPEGNDAENELEMLEPGTVQYLNPGESIHFPTLPQNPGLVDFVATQQRSIAAGYLVPYETLTGDYSKVNFSSGRLGQLGFQKQIAYWQFSMFIPKFCDKIFSWFVEGFKIAQSLDKETEVKANWTAPRREMIDPVKEVNAMRAEVRAGFATWSEKVRENGFDPETVLSEMGEDQKKFIAAGLMPDWTPYFELNAKVKMNSGTQEPKKKPVEE